MFRAPKTKDSNDHIKIKITSKNKIKRRRSKWEPETMKLPTEAVTSNDMNVNEAAKVSQMPRQTLDDWIKGKFSKEGASRNSELTPDEEEVQLLVSYCLFMGKMSQPLTTSHIKAFAWAITKKSSRKSIFNETSGPGWKWWRGFRWSHPEILLRKLDNLDRG